MMVRLGANPAVLFYRITIRRVVKMAATRFTTRLHQRNRGIARSLIHWLHLPDFNRIPLTYIPTNPASRAMFRLNSVGKGLLIVALLQL